MYHHLTQCGLVAIATLCAPAVAQNQGLYLRIGPQGLEQGGTDWKVPNEQKGFDAIVIPSESDLPVRIEVGGEWPLAKGFGLRTGLATLRIPASNYTWKQAYLDVVYSPWQRGNMRLYGSMGLGVGSMSSTFMVRQEAWIWDGATNQGRFDPGDSRVVDQSSRPFLRAAAGFQATRYFGVELNADRVSLKSGPTDPWPSAVINVGLNLVFRIPIEK